MNKKSRINRELFDILVRSGRNLSSDNLYIKYFLNKEDIDKESKFSFVISSKVSKKATERNLFKRRGRSIIKKLEDRLNKGFVCAFFAKNNTNKLIYSELENEILFLFEKSGILKN